MSNRTPNGAAPDRVGQSEMKTVGTEPKARRKRLRAPVEVDHKRTPKASEFRNSVDFVDGLGSNFLTAFHDALGEGKGAPGSIPGRAVLVAMHLNVTETNHKAEVTDMTAQIVALNPSQRWELNLKAIPLNRAYKRFHDKYSKVRDAFEAGFEFVDDDGQVVFCNGDWFINRCAERSIPQGSLLTRTIAIDGTDWETSGRFRRQKVDVPDQDYDGDAPPNYETDPEEHARAVAATRKRLTKKVQGQANREGTAAGIGPDGRIIHTTDPDDRGGYRTAVHGRKGGTYVGSEIHFHVQTRDFSWQGDISRIHEGPEVPNFIRAANLVPAGSHRGEAVMPTILANADNIDVIVWDRAYSVLPHEEYALRLLDAGISTVFDLTKYQRENWPVSEHAIWRDGTPLHLNTPEELLDLMPPPMHASAEEIKQYEVKYNERASWRWVKIAGPDTDGYTRWMCPFHAGRLRSRSFRQAKVNKNAPLVFLPDDVTKCCEGTITMDATYTRLMQAFAIPYGTGAWRWAYSRRNMVETANSYLGGNSFISLDRTYTRLMGHKNKKILLALMVAGLNQYIARSWRRRMDVKAQVATRGKSRKNTITALGAKSAETTASSSPATTAVSPPRRT